MEANILLSEINEQPLVIQNLLDKEWKNICKIASFCGNRFHNVIIAARGSSDNAARYAQYLFGNRNAIPVALATPSLYSLYKTPPELKDTLVIGISQSGKSPDIIEVIKSAKNQNCPTISITNDINSPLALNSDHIISINAGIEKSVAATKSYTCSLMVLALLSSAFNNSEKIPPEIQKIPSQMEKTLITSIKQLDHIERYRYADHCAVLGRGYQYGTAFEIALKIKELTRMVAEPYSSADFLHGPIATIQPGFPVIVCATSGIVFKDMSEIISRLKKRNADLVIISDKGSILDLANISFSISRGIEEYLAPILTVIPGQFFAMQLAIEKGINPDIPTELSKVTETY